ncbi:MAG TPA: ATP-binding cassette domain-containing protein [Candidatus Acidoferrum sp.]|nr:ATP-binding cassette domain-containing protein [Candidatus Acidoferrum sp.]
MPRKSSIQPPPASPPLIDLQNVRVMRGERAVLDDFSLRILPQEHIAILGPNGCGKSTLIKTLTRELYPVPRENSSISILGRERWNVFELRTLLGIVSNDLMTLCTTEATGLDVVLSGFFSATQVFDHHRVTPDQRQRALADLERLGAAPLAARPVDELSSGEAKRILIARALVHQPRALVFDEPTNSLDVFAQHGLRQTMRELAQSGIGIVLVTHHVADIIPEIDRVVLMRAGKIIADGPKQKLLAPAVLSPLFDIRVDISCRDGYYHLW